MHAPIMVRRVVGQSMLPTLRPGIVVMFRRFGKCQPGDIVVARVAGREVVKRVLWLDANHAYIVGDNPGYSTDSRQFGPIPVAAIVGTLWRSRYLIKS